MAETSQRQKAETLRFLHGNGRLLILTNVWDPIGARVVQAAGLPAVATASAAISASLGYQDGERIARSTMIATVQRIARSVDVPVTADMERGYGDTLQALAETIRLLIAAGAAGLNIEDSVGDAHELRPLDEQCDRIRTVREIAVTEGVPLVINARTDAFFSVALGGPEQQLDEAVRRAQAYAAAGADCIYPIGPGDRPTVKALRARIQAPLNILASPGAMSLRELQDAGIERVSFGPWLFRSALRHFADCVAQLADLGSYQCIARETLSRSEIERFLTPGPEEA